MKKLLNNKIRDKDFPKPNKLSNKIGYLLRLSYKKELISPKFFDDVIAITSL